MVMNWRFFRPSAGADVIDVRLLEAPFDPAGELASFTARHRGAGGVVSFLGQVREGDGVEALELKHYAPMTLPGMQALGRAARARWPVDGLLVLHRSGVMLPGDPIVLVAAASRHRRAAFEAADYVMDHLKGESWFWKREKTADGWRWIEPRADDHADRARW